MQELRNVTRYFPIIPSDTSSLLTLRLRVHSIWSLRHSGMEQEAGDTVVSNYCLYGRIARRRALFSRVPYP